MDANTKRTLTAAIRAAKSATAADAKLSTSTAAFVKAAGGFDQAMKILGAKRAQGATWKTERESDSPLWRVYNAVSVSKSRANPRKRTARQTTSKAAAGEAGKAAAGEAGKAAAGEAGKAAAGEAASRPATPADLAATLMLLDLPSLVAAFTDQNATTTAITVDKLRAVADALDTPAPPAPRAPAKRAPAKRAK